MWQWGVQCVEHQHGDTGVHTGGSGAAGLRGAQLRGVERVQLQRCVRADGDADADGDEPRVQLRQWAVRGEHQHGDAILHAQHQWEQLRQHPGWLYHVQWLQRHVR